MSRLHLLLLTLALPVCAVFAQEHTFEQNLFYDDLVIESSAPDAYQSAKVEEPQAQPEPKAEAAPMQEPMPTETNAQETLISEEPEIAKPKGPNYRYLDYSDITKYYILPDGMKVADRRATGALNPNLYTVVRQDPDTGFIYFKNESEETGCNLESMMRKHLYPKHGVDIRKYLNALAAPSCDDLASDSEKEFCMAFKSNEACQNAIPMALMALPLSADATYKTQGKDTFSCQMAKDIISDNKYVPMESTQWKKIKRDLVDKQRKAFLKNLKANPPVDMIRQQVLEKNPSASQRDINFAIQDYIYNEGVNFNTNIPSSMVQEVVEMRYAPYGVMSNLTSFANENGKSCSKMSKRYNTKMYGEVTNIPPHLLLLFADYIDMDNHCLCQ